MPNPYKCPEWGLFCFKGRWLGHPPFADWARDPEWVSGRSDDEQFASQSDHILPWRFGEPLKKVHHAVCNLGACGRASASVTLSAWPRDAFEVSGALRHHHRRVLTLFIAAPPNGSSVWVRFVEVV